MRKKIIPLVLLICASLFSPGMLMADSSHSGHSKDQMKPNATMEHSLAAGTFEHKMIDKQVRAEFQIMSLASMNMKDPDGATHHVMVKLFHDAENHPIMDAVGKIKVIAPDKSEQATELKNYNGVFAANFTFKAKGNHGVICLVSIDGHKHLFKFWYPHE